METFEQKKQFLDKTIKRNKANKSALMIVLQDAQNKFGYLSQEVQEYIAQGLGVSAQEVYSLVSFYSYFTTEPCGKYQVDICMGTACFVLGNNLFFDVLKNRLGIVNGNMSEDGLFSLSVKMCLGCCALAPVIRVNGEVYGKLDEKKLDEVINKYKKMGDK